MTNVVHAPEPGRNLHLERAHHKRHRTGAAEEQFCASIEPFQGGWNWHVEPFGAPSGSTTGSMRRRRDHGWSFTRLGARFAANRCAGRLRCEQHKRDRPGESWIVRPSLRHG